VTAADQATGGTGVTGTLATIKRDDGTTQVTYNGIPLYYYIKDTKAGDLNGQALNNVWFLVAPASTAASGAPKGGIGQDAAAASPAASTSGAANTVDIKNFAFAPSALKVAVGTTVKWTNSDTAAHTVTADGGSFDSKNIASGATFSQPFATAGTFTYKCTIHTTMTGAITVGS
jgi:plastocyanin